MLWIGPVVAGAAALAGGYWANRGRAGEAQKNRDFQKEMRQTQWQDTIKDMEAAGMNPALAYSQGPNAMPSGSQAQQSDVISPAISTAMQAKMVSEQFKLLQQQRQETAQRARKTMHEANVARLDEHQQAARWSYYFTPSGSPREPLRRLLEQEHQGAIATNARSVTELDLARLSIPEREALAELFDTLGQGGKGAQVLGPLLLQLLRR